MTTNPWVDRAAALLLLLFVYAVGYDYANQNAVQAQQNYPVAHLGLKP